MEVIETFNELEGCPNTVSNLVCGYSIGHGSSTPVLECWCSAAISSNPIH